jgi:hypothetical protein
MSRRPLVILGVAATVAAAVLAVPASPAAAAPATASTGALVGALVPATPVMDGRRLLLNRVRLALGDRQLRSELRSLTAQADQWLDKGPWAVTDKAAPAASGDIHDYLSRALYFWPTQPPTPENPRGCPYRERDGVPNPEVYVGTDKLGGVSVLTAVPLLSLAWYYTRNPAYAEHAALLLRTWYVDPATRMNPNLNYAQGIVCRVDGRSIGIIDFAQFFTINLDAMAILDTGAPGWSAADRAGMRGWNAAYLDWLVNSPFGKAELATTNNHGSFAAMQIAGLALALGDRDLALSMVRDKGRQLIDSQIKADGTQPLELSRTRTWHYSNYNLSALTRLATIGRHLGVNLWDYRGPDGQSLSAAVDYLLPAATGSPWTLPELEFHRYYVNDMVHAAAEAGDRDARRAVAGLEPVPAGDVWDLRPAPQHFF